MENNTQPPISPVTPPAPAPAPVTPPQPAEQPITPAPAKKSQSKLILIIITAVLAVGVIVTALLVL